MSDTSIIESEALDAINRAADLAAAQEHFHKAMDLRIEHLGDSHIKISESLYGLATVARKTEDFATAAAHFQRAIDIREQLQPGTWVVADLQSCLGECLFEMGRIEDARALLGPSLEKIRAAIGPDNEHTLEAQARLTRLEEHDRTASSSAKNASK